MPSPRSSTATAATATNDYTTAAQRQLPFEVYPEDDIREEISRFFHDNLPFFKPAHDNDNDKDKGNPAAAAAATATNNNVASASASTSAEAEAETEAGTAPNNYNYNDEIEYDIAVLAFDDELKLHKVHPLFRDDDDDDESNFNRPDHVLARQIRVHVPLSSATSSAAATSLRQEHQRRCEDIVTRLYREVLSKHDMLDTAVEIYYYYSSENEKREHEQDDKRNRRRLLWFPPEQFWYKGIGTGTGTCMKMDRDGLRAYVEGLVFAPHRRDEEGEEEVSGCSSKGGEASEGEAEGEAKGGMDVEV